MRFLPINSGDTKKLRLITLSVNLILKGSMKLNKTVLINKPNILIKLNLTNKVAEDNNLDSGKAQFLFQIKLLTIAKIKENTFAIIEGVLKKISILNTTKSTTIPLIPTRANLIKRVCSDELSFINSYIQFFLKIGDCSI